MFDYKIFIIGFIFNEVENVEFFVWCVEVVFEGCVWEIFFVDDNFCDGMVVWVFLFVVDDDWFWLILCFFD